MDSHLVIRNLFPGGVYEVKVFALSHDLPSEPHEYFQAVCEYSKNTTKLKIYIFIIIYLYF